MPDDTDDWNPEPATLREGEREDLSPHARRNIELIREGEREGLLDSESAEEAVERIKDADKED